MQDFKKLRVWEQAHHLTLAVYQATRIYPKEELYGLTSQTRRAGAFIPTNIAEGCGRDSNAELTRFLHMAMGSASELEYELLLARDLQFLPPSDYERLIQELLSVKRMLNAFIQKVRTNNHN